ncbi:protocatechuate 3,4-dioxygenase subunit beta [Pseudonocardia asaccharolytica]|uniref:Protocatechuate 3,4-dioxygenase subunit beta n=1 Tax=Pseudonocardia asaccharolytica DSM 44247 = NBRC 16224 TaxID=1123024 RepID=A0A511D1R4_9PSEU|nr:protocatechuate 3,4-dioxygenase subunit beta [Pseudonocardia asaccharolytica]GEL18732.1 protocatechuate 3,4-dioxygenase subunit beta [Pseudonocardia asaccharolytica DSM 44247 = NBRC 16224]
MTLSRPVGYRSAPDGTHPPLDHPDYRSTAPRAPSQPPIVLPHRLTEVTGPLLAGERIGERDHDLTTQHDGEALGQRIVVFGRVCDSDGRAVPDTLVEIWQANAAGRYAHPGDNWSAPLDPNFTGGGRVVTDSAGNYSFTTIKPGAYPWSNHHNAWRPSHIHFSLFGRAFTQRLVTQMYFPDDPLFAQDPIFNSVPDPKARQRLISTFDLAATRPGWALAYRFDIVLRGREQTPFEEPHD